MNNYLKTLQLFGFLSGMLLLANPVQANTTNLTFSRFFSNNNDRVFMGSSLEITGGGNIYAVDGFNNTLQVLNPTTQFFSFSSNDAQFRWTKTLSIDETGNIDRSNQVSYDGSSNVYVVDGINNGVQASASSNGNIVIVDGINNNIQSEVFENESNYSWNWASNSQDEQGLSFFAALFGNPQSFFNGQFNFPNSFSTDNSWLNNLNFDNYGNLNQFINVSLNDAENIYVIDGINNQIQVFNSSPNNIGNVYLVNGINSSIEILPYNPTVAVPEPNTILGALLFGAGTRFFRRIVNGQKQGNKYKD